jgi:2-keto-4-pentenoate hydratase/2-oxohepta-3-ene-1,7-dioic acid hydratase in catechol pathway
VSRSPDRIVRVAAGDREVWGAIRGQEVVHLPAGPFPSSAETGETLGSLEETPLLAPVRPSKIVCVARNYAAHAAEHRADVPTTPLLFFKPPSAVVGPGAAIELPPESERVEHEAELALVIGRRCRRVSEAEAWGAVLGVTAANDVTARDIQRSEKLWTRGKGFDTFCPVGPWIVTGLVARDLADLGVRCIVNGELRQDGRTSEMVFSSTFLISYISQVMTLEPGDLVLTGTPAGVGPLEPGDTVIVEIEGVGTLTNPVTAESEELRVQS